MMELKKKKSLVFGIKCKVRKMLVFGENKSKAKDNAKADVTMVYTKELAVVMKLKEKKPWVFGENNIETELKNVKKQDLDRLDHNAKTKIGKGNANELKDMM